MRFDSFIVLAAMRTGSNFLEANLNALAGVACHGEAFNPYFIGYPDRGDLLGISREERDRDPLRLLSAIREQRDKLAGFRFFHDHDPRVLGPALDDPRCAKIVLTRNPLESYVSRKIAQMTGQWKLTDMSRRKSAQVRFDPEEFAAHVATLGEFHRMVLARLQEGGQTAFLVSYEDIQRVEVVNGLAHWLGVADRLKKLDGTLLRQNPAPIREKISNPGEMETALAAWEPFETEHVPGSHPRRGPAVPSYVATRQAPLLFLPMPGGPHEAILGWMARLDGGEAEDLLRGMTQKILRRWKRDHPGHRSFTVLRHPTARAHHVFCTHILDPADAAFDGFRGMLERDFDAPVAQAGEDREAHRRAFKAYLDFVSMNLNGQTPVRTDPAWAMQAQALAGFGDFVLPDHVLREGDLARSLPFLAGEIGRDAPLPPRPDAEGAKFPLSAIHDAEIEKKVSRIYRRDFMMFGFAPWSRARAGHPAL